MKSRGVRAAVVFLVLAGVVGVLWVSSVDGPARHAVAPSDVTPPQEPPRRRSRVHVRAAAAEAPVPSAGEPTTAGGTSGSSAAAGRSSVVNSPERESAAEIKTVRARFLMAGLPAAGVRMHGATSDADGRLVLRQPRGRRGFLIALQPDGARVRLDYPQDDSDVADLGDIRLAPAGTIAGVVVDESGEPVAGARVTLLSSDLDCRTLGSMVTDEDGRFTFNAVGPYRYEVYARVDPASGSKTAPLGARLTAVSAHARDVRLVARPMFAVTLRLLDETTGAPITINAPWIACELRRPGAALDASFHELRHNRREVGLFLADPGYYEIDARVGTGTEYWAARVPAVELGADRESVVDVKLRRY